MLETKDLTIEIPNDGPLIKKLNLALQKKTTKWL